MLDSYWCSVTFISGQVFSASFWSTTFSWMVNATIFRVSSVAEPCRLSSLQHGEFNSCFCSFGQGRLWSWSTSSFWPCTSSLLHLAHVDWEGPPANRDGIFHYRALLLLVSCETHVNVMFAFWIVNSFVSWWAVIYIETSVFSKPGNFYLSYVCVSVCFRGRHQFPWEKTSLKGIYFSLINLPSKQPRLLTTVITRVAEKYF